MTLYARSYSDTFKRRLPSYTMDVSCGNSARAYEERLWEIQTIGKQWWVNSNYTSDRASGRHLAPNPYLKINTIVRRPAGYTHVAYCVPPCAGPGDTSLKGQVVSGVHTGYESDLSDPGLPVRTDAELRATCVNKAILNAKSDLSLLLSDFYQRKQTEQMLGNTVLKLVDVVRALKHGRVGDALRALSSQNRRFRRSSPAELWLEIQYGWKPLLADAKDIFDALTPITALVKSTGRTKDTQRNAGKVSIYGETVFFDQTVEKKCTTKLFWTFPGDGVLLHAAQQGVLAPLEVAWDLLPWSFVVDWWLPIGDYFQALNASISLQYVDGTSTIKQTSYDRRNAVFVAPACAYPNGHYRWSWEQTRKQRYVEPNAVYTFQAKNPFSFTHLANALALLTTEISGISSRGR
jgi:hypothetical protein